MLKQLRQKQTAKKIWIILAIIIVPAFTLWGTGSIIRSRKENDVIGRVFGRPITVREYKDAVEAVKNIAILQLGDSFFEMQKYLNLPALAEERIILLYEAKRRNIKVTDQEVIDYLTKIPIFQGKDGLDKQRYYLILKTRLHTQPRVFEEQLRNGLAIHKLFDQITQDVTVTEDEVKKEYCKRNEEFAISYIESRPQDFTQGLVPEEEQLKEYFAKNTLNFKEPLSFNLEYVTIPLPTLSEEAAKTQADQIYNQLKKEKSFSDAAKKLGFQVKETGLFQENEPIPEIGWSNQLAVTLFKSKVNNVLPPVYADKKIYIFKVKERKEPTVPEFATIKEKVKDAWVKEQSFNLAQKKIEECLNRLKQKFASNPEALDLEKEANQLGLKYGSTKNFKYGSYIEGIGLSNEFFNAASQLKENEFSQIINTPQAFYIIKVASRLPIDEKKFAEEKEKFQQQLLLEKKEERFEKFKEELKERSSRF